MHSDHPIITESVSTLFLLSGFESNTEFAIGPLERVFFQAGERLAAGNTALVHFAYRSLELGAPRSLPSDFRNVFAFDMFDRRQENVRRIETYVRTHEIELVVLFDVQPADPLFGVLRRAGVRTIVSYWGAPISGKSPWLQLQLKRAMMALSRSRVDSLVFESRAMADLATMGRGVPAAMIDLVPLGVDTEIYHPGQSTVAHDALGIPRERRLVLFAGHVAARKGIATLMKAAVELLVHRNRTDVAFVLCGNRPGESGPYEAMYEGLGVEQFIRFAGYRTDMPEMYRSAFCGVIPSDGWDSFTTSSLEMAASGLPVVASRLDGLPEAVLDEHTGLLFSPGSATELADTLSRLLDSPGLAASLGSNGRRRCEVDLSKHLQVNRLVSVLKSRLSRSQGKK